MQRKSFNVRAVLKSEILCDKALCNKNHLSEHKGGFRSDRVLYRNAIVGAIYRTIESLFKKLPVSQKEIIQIAVDPAQCVG